MDQLGFGHICLLEQWTLFTATATADIDLSPTIHQVWPRNTCAPRDAARATCEPLPGLNQRQVIQIDHQNIDIKAAE